MRFPIKSTVVLLVLGGLYWFALPPLVAYWKERNKPRYREEAVSCGEVVMAVNSSGTVQPVLNVQVGSFVSGPIQKVCVDFNDHVKKDQVMAEIDPLIPKAQLNQSKASLASAKANLMEAEATLEQTKREWKRAETLVPKNAISEADYDLAKAAYETAKAKVAVCEAAIQQSEASLELAEINLGYTVIKAPVDGIVIDRKVDTGQTVASQFQTPEMFKVAPDMEKRMFVFASVDEADIGLIRDAQRRDQPVTFTVDAYPNDLFEGKVHQVRLNPTTTQNVVTYSVVVESPNPELKLLPGMTATLTFQIEKHEKVLRVPNAALRFFPKSEQVRPEDRPLLDGGSAKPENDEHKEDDDTVVTLSAKEKAEAQKEKNRRHVWIIDGDFLKAVEIVIGLSDGKYSEVAEGELKEEQKIVTGMASPTLNL